jgi:streptogramin lyase
MTRRQMPSDLTPEVARYLNRMRSLDRPVELVDRIMAEVEATPQLRPAWFAALPVPVLVAAVAAAAVIAVAVVFRLAPPHVGPQPSPTPVPSGQLPTAGEVVNRIPIESTYAPRVFGLGFLWMEDIRSGEVVRLDPETGAIDTLDITKRVGFETMPAIDETSVWAVDTYAQELVEIDPESMAETRRFQTGIDARGLAVGGGFAWLIGGEHLRESQEVARVDLASETVDLRVPIQEPSAVMIDGDSVWVTSWYGQLTRLDANTGAIEDVIDTPGPIHEPSRVGDAIVMYGGPFAGIVSVDVDSGKVTARTTPALPEGIAPANDAFGSPTSGDGRVWAADGSRLLELDPTTLKPVAALPMGLTELHGMVYGAGALWAAGLDAAGDAVLLRIAPAP